jgi:hypothetical protein
MILNPVSRKYCSYGIDEYCKDSRSYLQLLHDWKSSYVDKDCKEDLFLVAADVQALYPSVRREIVRNGLKEALDISSDYSQAVKNIITDLTMFCLENVVVQNGDKFYQQTNGIITGDNHSVSVANIALHHVMLPVAETLRKAVLFKRYIDDIMWISKAERITNQLQETLSSTFQNNGLKLIFRRINTKQENSTLEFLDVNHVINAQSSAGFYTTNYVKPTALNRAFLNGSSYHPRSVFKSIIFSESTRLRRLNERDELYLKAIDELEAKCYKSGFARKLVADMIKITKYWTDRFGPPKSSCHKPKQRIVWATSFPNLVKLSRKEKELNGRATVVYKRPRTLSNQLENYKFIAHEDQRSSARSSGPCGRCSLCGNFGKAQNMVATTDSIMMKNGRYVKVAKASICSDWGIYVATCRICGEHYVGQTCTTFSKRWNTHRSTWRNGAEDVGDKAALLKHYSTFHPTESGRDLEAAFTVTFVDRSNDPSGLDLLESRWINRLKATINISKTVLPRFT